MNFWTHFNINPIKNQSYFFKQINLATFLLICCTSFLSVNVKSQSQSVSCILQLTPDPITICVGECANLFNTSFGPNGNLDTACFPNFYWLMVGGIPSSYLGSQAPCITYNTPGVYTVFLYEVNNVGDTMFLNYVSSTVNVLPNLSPNMTINPNPACADEIVTFSYTDSTATANYVFGILVMEILPDVPNSVVLLQQLTITLHLVYTT